MFRVQPPRKKSKAEVMAEVMAKSKEHKVRIICLVILRSVDLTFPHVVVRPPTSPRKDDATRHAMDSDFASIRDLLFGGKVDPSASSANAIPLGSRSWGAGASDPTAASDPAGAPTDPAAGAVPVVPVKTAGWGEEEKEDDYDTLVHSLAFSARAKPTDRTKTEDELAADEAERLQSLEQKRLRRMRGEVDGSDDEEGGKGKGKGRAKRKADADDLEDDFELGSDGEAGALGPGLEVDLDEDEDEEEGSEEDGDGESGSEEEDGSAMDEDEDEESGIDADIGEPSSLAPSSKKKAASKPSKPKYQKGQELPFTFPCPATHEEFLEIIDGIDEADVPTVISRIRAIYHPSLKEGNKDKLQVRIFTF